MTASKSSSEESKMFGAFLSFLQSTEIDLDKMTERELDQLLKEEKISVGDADKTFKDFIVGERTKAAFRKSQRERAGSTSGIHKTLSETVIGTRQEILDRIQALIMGQPNLLASVKHRNFQEMTDRDLATLELEFKALLIEEG